MPDCFFPSTKEHLEYLTNADPILGKVIVEIGEIKRVVNTEPFSALIRNIVAQQISVKAAQTIYARIEQLFVSDMVAEQMILLSVDELQKCGISRKKADNILFIARQIAEKTVDFSLISQMSDDEVTALLCTLPGIGVWTAQMLMLFTFLRPDIVSYGDLSIRRGMMYLYGLDSLSKQEFAAYRAKYTPYGSLASLYLWEISNRYQSKEIAT